MTQFDATFEQLEATIVAQAQRMADAYSEEVEHEYVIVSHKL